MTNSINNNQDDIYGAVIMARSHCESSPGSFDESAPGGRQPSDQVKQLGLRVRRKMAANIRIYNRHLLLLTTVGAPGRVV